MPEGPEVYVIANQLNDKIKGWTIDGLQIVGGRYMKHGSPSNYDDFVNLYEGKTVKAVYSHGKFIWFEIEYHNIHGRKDNEQEYGTIYIGNTLGMSAHWGFEKMKHSDIEVLMTNLEGEEKILYFTDQRHFGTLDFFVHDEIGQTPEQMLQQRLNKLGPTFLTIKDKVNKMTDVKFTNIIRSKPKSNICNVLMNQNLMAGIGNYILSECLYLSKINPWTKCKEMSDNEIDDLYWSVQTVMLSSLEHKGVSTRNYLDVDGEKGDYQSQLRVYGKNRDPKGNKVMKQKGPHGRTIHWVKELQGEKR